MSYAFIIPDSNCVVSPQNDTEHSRAERENLYRGTGGIRRPGHLI